MLEWPARPYPAAMSDTPDQQWAAQQHAATAGPWLASASHWPRLSGQFISPSSPIVLVLRVLIAVGLVLGMAQMATRPVERSVDDLLAALRSGHVSAVSIDRPGPGEESSGSSRVEWSGQGRPAFASYEYSTMEGSVQFDEGEAILRAADAAGVPVTVTGPFSYPSGISFPNGAPGALAGLAVLLLLIGGPQPRLATKWAWFWLGIAVTPLWLAFVVLEPLPMWADRPQPAARRRLTGGWAFLLSLVLAAVVTSAWPELSDVLTS